jgi:hypothetical protein
MPRYFFHVFDMIWSHDQDGEELPDLEAAVVQARHIARELLVEDEETGAAALDSFIEVADEHGSTVRVIRFRDVVEP